MAKNKTWIVTLDFTKMDASILEYSLFLSKVLHPKEIHFAFVAKEMKSFSYLPDEYLGFRNQIFEDQKLTLKSRVDQVFQNSGVDYHIHISAGSPFDEVINLVIQQSADLVIAGRKKESGGSGIVSDRLSSGLPCDFLLVPEDFKPALKNILVTTDFSDHSTLALQKASEIKSADNDVQLTAHHGYDIPEDWEKSGKTYDDFVDISKRISEREMGRWISSIDFNVKSILTLLTEHPLATEVMNVAQDNKADMIIVGSKGQTRESLIMLGSNTLKLMKANPSIPLMIVKKEGENLKLLEVLKES